MLVSPLQSLNFDYSTLTTEYQEAKLSLPQLLHSAIGRRPKLAEDKQGKRLIEFARAGAFTLSSTLRGGLKRRRPYAERILIMLLGINISECEYNNLNDAEKLKLLDAAAYRAKQARLRAENYKMRLSLVRCPYEQAAKVLNERELSLVKMLDAGLFE